MKLTYLLSILLISCTTVTAQVYSFTPTIRFKSSYFTFRKGIVLEGAIDTLCKVGQVIVDIDNKKISNPESIERPLAFFPITSVSYDAANRMYKLDAEDPYTKHKFLYFNVKLNSNNEIVYVKKVKRFKGNVFRGDTTFSTFTNTLMDIEFSVNSSRMKENLMLSADTAESSKQVDEFYDAPYINQDTKVEMRNGYINWTEGKGSNMKYHSYHIDEVSLKHEEGKTKGFQLLCNVSPSLTYVVRVYQTRRKMVDQQNGWVNVIVILKIVDRKRGGISVIESY